jgi:vancomycin permeability regulator SanA
MRTIMFSQEFDCKPRMYETATKNIQALTFKVSLVEEAQ